MARWNSLGLLHAGGSFGQVLREEQVKAYKAGKPGNPGNSPFSRRARMLNSNLVFDCSLSLASASAPPMCKRELSDLVQTSKVVAEWKEGAWPAV